MRLYFFTNWEKWHVPRGFKSFGYLRSYYRDDSGIDNDLVIPALPVYPKREAMLLEIPILESLKKNPYSFRKIGFKKVITKRPYPKQWLVSESINGKPPVLDWSLAIEYLIDGT